MGCLQSKNTKDEKETHINTTAASLAPVDLPSLDSNRESELLKFKEVQQMLKGLEDTKSKEIYFGFDLISDKEADEEDIMLLGCRRLASLGNLQTLNLYLEKIFATNNSMNILAKVLPRFQNLTKLTLSFKGTKLTDEGLISISGAIRSYKRLFTLEAELGDTPITETGVIAFSDALGEFKNLNSLSLDFSYPGNSLLNRRSPTVTFSDDAATSLSQALSQLKNVATLKLNVMRTHLGDRGTVALSNAIKELSLLEDFSLLADDTFITSEGGTSLTSALKHCKQLQRVYINPGGDVNYDGKEAMRDQLREMKLKHVYVGV